MTSSQTSKIDKGYIFSPYIPYTDRTTTTVNGSDFIKFAMPIVSRDQYITKNDRVFSTDVFMSFKMPHICSLRGCKKGRQLDLFDE